MMDDPHVQENKTHPAKPQTRLQAVVVENFRVISQPGAAFEATKARLIRQGLSLEETPHFLITRLPHDKLITLVHRFSTAEIDNNAGYYLMRELSPYALINSEQAFGATLIGVVTSTLPHDPVAAWNHFSLNTLQRLQAALEDNSPGDEEDFITTFARIYRRLFELKTGSSLLDVGCACAFWPVLVAEHEQERGRIVGVDNRLDAIHLSSNLAQLTKVDAAEFVLADVLAADFPAIGLFDTVTAIHVLEHLPEAQVFQALSNLLQVTRQRLLIAVPYEEQPEVAYGHARAFHREHLEALGRWCIEQLHGQGRAHCEDLEGGLLMVERDGGG